MLSNTIRSRRGPARRTSIPLKPFGKVFVAALLWHCFQVYALDEQAATQVQQSDVDAVTREFEQQLDELKARLQALEQGETPAARDVSVKPSVSAAEQGRVGQVKPTTEALEEDFVNTTESRARFVRLDNRVVADRVEEVLNEFVDIKGYFRAGYGRNDQGGTQPGFKAPGAMAKYRLGNEAENFGEIIFGKNFFSPGGFGVDNALSSSASPQGPVAHMQFRLDFFNAHSDSSSASNTLVGLPEAWASVGNVFPMKPSIKFWAGNRFYRRHDIGLNDFFFWNMSGGGAGVEDIPMGKSKLAIAWIGTGVTSGFSDLPQPDPENKAGFSKTNIDVRLYDVAMFGGEGEFGLILSKAKSGLDADGNQSADSSGYAFNFVHTRSQFISVDGVNKLSVQYGTEAAKTFTSGFETFNFNGGVYIQPDLEGSWRFRFTENFTANINDRFSVGPVLIYQVTDYGDAVGQQTWMSAGVRPVVHFNDRVSIAFEGGWDHVNTEYNNTSDSLYKFTIAPQISLGGRFNSRPVIRAFATWAAWGDSFIGSVGGNDYLGKNDGASFGVQMEAWW